MDHDYFVSRAEEEEDRAAKACDPFARDAHFRLAVLYRAAAANRGPRAVPDRPLQFTRLTIR